MTQLPANELCSTCQAEIDVYECNAEMCHTCKRLFCYECCLDTALFDRLLEQCAAPCEPSSPLDHAAPDLCEPSSPIDDVPLASI